MPENKKPETTDLNEATPLSENGTVVPDDNDEHGFFRRNVANFLTLLNVVFGSLSILVSINGRFRWALSLILMASVADRYDGWVARRLGTSSELGVQLDSLGDSISFGVAPALLIYMSLFKPMQPSLLKLALTACVVIYIICGIFRLARYNTRGCDDGYYEGLPITIAGMTLAFLTLLNRELSILVYGFLMLLLAVLMVSKFRIRKR